MVVEITLSYVDRLGKMGASIHTISLAMKEELEAVVRKIAGKEYEPQGIANIIYSFSQMQYSWEMIREDTREAFLHMIRQSAGEFNAQVWRE